jgi:hypothetical protein
MVLDKYMNGVMDYTIPIKMPVTILVISTGPNTKEEYQL